MSDTNKQHAAAMSQWQLIRRAFARHRLAMTALCVLAVLYTVAIGAEFFEIQNPQQAHIEYAYCPPQMPAWSPSKGLHTSMMIQHENKFTLRSTYTQDADLYVPLTLLAKSEPYRLFGLIPLQHRLIGIDQQAWAELTKGADLPEDYQPCFYPLGSDRYGRCVFSRAVGGARISLSIGLIGIGLTFLLGAVIGGISGYVGGYVDNIIQRTIEIVHSVPALPLWIALAAVFPPAWSPLKTYFAITVLLSLLGWTGLARVVRGKILSLREEDYATAARLLGASHRRVLFRHLLPGFASHIIVVLTLSIPAMILGETALSFLGLGLRSPVVSWGVMLQDCFDVKAVRFYPWLLMPVFFVVVTVLSFNFVGDGLRDAADPYASR